MKWTKELPTVPGWYWQRNPERLQDGSQCVQVRNYAGELAIGNCTLVEGRYEWAGPIPLPSENN